ncbi:MAG: 50S ribosomal protein L14e [Candidatus Diapherotrites archaeon CG08_land_8_20_14_0_20_34_12]|nr:MAG: 50S ribosomal protein L14e [Candidatus Diapherotrites archaeon CG08_land_8_20_14_0_20_34_12]
MKIMTTGRVCYKKTGRNAGEKVIIVKSIDKNTVEIMGLKTKKQKCNIPQLFPTKEVVKIKEHATSKEIQEALKK